MKSIHNICLLFFLLVAIAIVYIYPDTRFIIEAEKQYKGIGFTGTQEELLYLSRINGIYKGSANLSDIYCFEHQNDPWFRPFIGEFIIGNIGKMLKADITTLDILMSAVLNMVLGLLVFIFSFQLSRSVKLSIICSFAIMFGYNIFSANIGILKAIVITRDYAKPLWFLRPMSPQFYYIPFLIALIFIHRAICISSNKKNILIAGITLGLLFYCNVYYWTFIYAGLGILAVIYFCIKEKKSILYIFSIYIISIIAAIPYLISVFNVINHPNYEYLQKNYMIFNSYRLLLYYPYIIPAIIVSALLLFFKHRSRFFIFSFLMGGIVCLNHRLLTGKNILQQWSFYSNKTFLIISIIVCFQILFIGRLGLKFPRYGKIISNQLFKGFLFIVTLLFFSLVAFSQQNNYYHANKGLFLEKQKLAGAYDWLRANNNKNEVVLTDPFQDCSTSLTNYRLLLTYTNKFSYIAEPACMLISEKETIYRILSALLFLGYKEDDIEKYIYSLEQSYILVDPYLMIHLPPKDYYETIRTRYKALSKRPPIDVIRRYKIDYILIENKDAFKMGGKYSNNLKVVYKDNDYTIFKFK